MATIKDVAAVAGVSFTTVSHVVNNTRPVSADVRSKVELAIRQLNYVPSAVARSSVRPTVTGPTVGTSIGGAAVVASIARTAVRARIGAAVTGGDLSRARVGGTGDRER